MNFQKKHIFLLIPRGIGSRVRRLSGYGVLQVLCQWVCILAFRIRVLGRSNVPQEGGVLLVSNHQSYLDPVLVGVGLSREIHYMARSSLFRNEWFRRLIVSLNAFPLKREGTDVGTLRRAVRLLKEGRVVLVFPEGTRTETGAIQLLHRGFTLIAKEGRARIVPVAIEGAFRAWPRKRHYPRSSPITISFGRPVPFESYSKMSSEEIRGEIENRLKQLHRTLLWMPERR